MFWVYGVVPHQWLTWADNELNWRADKILFGPGRHLQEPAGRWLVADPDQLRRRARPHRRRASTSSPSAPTSAMWSAWQKRGDKQDDAKTPERSTFGRPAGEGRGVGSMTTTDANPPLPEFRDDYILQQVDAAWLTASRSSPSSSSTSTSPSASCARAASTSARGSASTWSAPTPSTRPIGTELPGSDPGRQRDLHHRRRRVHPLRAVRRSVPDRRHHPRQDRRPGRPRATPTSERTPTVTATACVSADAERSTNKNARNQHRPCMAEPKTK